MEQRLYYKFSGFLVDKYGEKIYKLPVNIDATCPNRDGTKGTGGCIFCGDEGAGFECLSSSLSVRQQLEDNKNYIGSHYGAKKFIAYFQNYSNTYMAVDKMCRYIKEACLPGIVAIYVSTRPDCVSRAHVDALAEIQAAENVDIVLELGLQTANINTLRILERHHGLAEFISAAELCKSRGIATCAHYITDLPWDTAEDTAEGARFISSLGVGQVKLHSLYILRNTKIGRMYEEGMVKPVSKNEFIERTIIFLENLDPQIVVQRLLGRAPADRSLFCSWNTSWRKIVNETEEKMMRENRYQGRLYQLL